MDSPTADSPAAAPAADSPAPALAAAAGAPTESSSLAPLPPEPTPEEKAAAEFAAAAKAAEDKALAEQQAAQDAHDKIQAILGVDEVTPLNLLNWMQARLLEVTTARAHIETLGQNGNPAAQAWLAANPPGLRKPNPFL